MRDKGEGGSNVHSFGGITVRGNHAWRRKIVQAPFVNSYIDLQVLWINVRPVASPRRLSRILLATLSKGGRSREAGLGHLEPPSSPATADLREFVDELGRRP